MPAKSSLKATFHFLGKGDFKDLLLHILEERPMHGYEVMRSIEERYHGLYRPSAGTVYPALRALLRQGLVDVSGEERKKIYRLSRKGVNRMKKQRAEMDRRFHILESAVGPERAAFFRELRATGRVIGHNLRTITPEQAVELRKILITMRKRMMKVLAK